MIKFLLFLVVSFCIMIDCAAQKDKTTNSIILEVDSLNQLADKLRRSDPISALLLTEQAEKLAISNSYQLGKGVALKNKALIASAQGRHIEALNSVEKSIAILEKTSNKIDLGAAYGLKGYLKDQLGENDIALDNYEKAISSLKSVKDTDVSIRLAIAYNLLGIYYQRTGNHVQSLTHFNEALALVEDKNQPRFTSAFLSNIGNTHLYLEEYEKAIPYYEKTVAIQEKIDDKAGLAVSYNNLGATFLSQEKSTEALPYLQKASQIYEEVGDAKGYLLSQMNIGLVYYDRNEYDEATKYFKECLELEEEITDKNTLATIYYNLAACSNLQKNYDSAIVYAQKGLEVAKAIDAKKTIIDNLRSISISYERKKDFEKAYEYHLIYTTYKDSLFNIEKASEVNALLLDQKELENTQLEKDNIIQQNALQKERLEKQAQSQALLILEKQAEADRLLALAKESKNKQEADSLYRAAQNAQLEADNLKIKADNLNIKAQKAEAEKRANEAENKQKIAFQRNISIIFGIGILAALLIAYIAYRNQKNKQKANLLLAEKNEEINLQNELLNQANRSKDQLFSIIAHDLRSPITAFQGVSKQINFFLRKNQPERLEQISSSIDSSAQNLNNLLNNLLNWSLTETKQFSIDKKETNLFQNIEETLKVYQLTASENKIELENKVPKNTMVFVDKDSFQTIIRNLVGNAIKYTPENGKISISAEKMEAAEKTEETKNQILLKVTDTGIGIKEEFKEKLFQLSVAHSSRGIRGEKGTGLGLVLCYQFAELNDIKIAVESEEEKGTTFLLTIPMS